MNLSDPRDPEARGSSRSRDAVAAIYEQWQKERPDIDPAPVWVFGLLGRVQQEGTGLINRALAPLGLTRPSYDVLTALRRSGAPFALTPKQISQYLLLSGSGLNSRINTLESKKLIARMPEPSDRRTVLIQLTLEGMKVVDRAIPIVFDIQRRALEQLEGSVAQTLTEALAQMSSQMDLMDRQMTEAEAAGTEAG